MAGPQVAVGDHTGSTGESEKALFSLDVIAGDQQDVSESLHGMASRDRSRRCLGIFAPTHIVSSGSCAQVRAQTMGGRAAR